MSRLAILLGVVLSLFSTTVMSYISMATSIGPWIAPTLALCGLLFYSCMPRAHTYKASLIYATIAGSIGGILSTAFGFTLPALYFLDQQLFLHWMASRSFFVTHVGAIALMAGWYGMWIANVTEVQFVHQKELPFPVGQMVYKMLCVQRHIKKAWQMAFGFLSAALVCVLQDGLFSVSGVIPKAVDVCRACNVCFFSLPLVRFDLSPMLWAIGFIAGHMVVAPLLVGSIAKMLVVDPMQTLWFNTMAPVDFLLAFCSGMVFSGLLGNLMPQKIIHAFKDKKKFNFFSLQKACLRLNRVQIFEGCLVLGLASVVLFGFGFNLLSQIYLLVFTFVCSYQIIIIAGKIGLAPLGRFATFVLVPALFLFELDNVQIVFVSMFVEATAGVAVDVLVGRKVVCLAGVDWQRAKKYQYLGLLVSCIVIGFVFLALIDHFGLGTPELFAQRGQARQLLVNVQQYNYMAVFIGAVFGLLLKKMKLSPMLVLGGLLMPLNNSLGLMAGGAISMVIKDRQEWYPFWSGVFAANSIWMLVRAIF